jgi:antitoxin (DNA-binding transcriptional repressor) of toxin-antitoxin stability system
MQVQTKNTDVRRHHRLTVNVGLKATSESFWIHMNSVTVRDLRTAFPKIEVTLLNGQEVAITKRGKIVTLLVQPAKRKLFDIRQRKLAASVGFELLPATVS